MVEVNFSFGVDKIFVKVLEVATHACAAINRPTQIQKEGKARALARQQEAIIDAQTESFVQKIRKETMNANEAQALLSDATKKMRGPNVPLLQGIGTDNSVNFTSGTESDTQSTVPNIVDVVELRERLIGVERLLNLRSVFRSAEEAAERIEDTVEAVGPDPVLKDDWVEEWVRGAERAKSKDVREIWAKILVGEIKQPNNFSKRTLLTLQGFGQDEASLLAKIAPYIIANLYFVFEEETKNPMRFNELLLLQECGLLEGVGGLLQFDLKSNLQPDGNHIAIIRNENIGLILFCSEEVNFSFSINKPTRPAVDLIRLGNFSVDQNYLRLIFADIKKQGDFSKIKSAHIAQVARQPDGKINFSSIETLKVEAG
jgi:hypothetical protein